MSKIEVSTKQVSESTNDLQVSVEAWFEHDLLKPSEQVSAEECLQALVDRLGYASVYELAVGQYIIAIQAPARKMLVELWHGIAPSERAELIQRPNGDSKVATVQLPEAQRLQLESSMAKWKYGERAPRSRVQVVREDPIEAIARSINDGTLSGEALDEMRARVSELLGLQGRRR